MLGFDSFMLTLWKKFFSCGQNRNVNCVMIIIQKTAMVTSPQKIHWCIKTKSNPFKIPSQRQVGEKSRALTLGLNSETIHKYPQVSKISFLVGISIQLSHIFHEYIKL